jgi:hypothetical protein
MMSANRNFTDQDYEVLSAYLDGALSAGERSDLEARLETDAGLRGELAALQQTVALVQGLAPRKAPRNFTLTPAMVRVRPSRWLIFPTSAGFSAVAGAAATILILIGAATFFLQNAGSQSSPLASAGQDSQSQIALQSSPMPTINQKTAETESSDEETANPVEILPLTTMTIAASPLPDDVDGVVAPETSTGGDGFTSTTINPQQPQSTLQEGYGGATSAGEESAQQEALPQDGLPPAPIQVTTLYAATMVMPPASPPNESPSAAADSSAAPVAGSADQNTNNETGVAASIMADQVAAVMPTPSVAALFQREADASMTAPESSNLAFAQAPGTPTAAPTLRLSATAVPTASSSPSSTPQPTATLTVTVIATPTAIPPTATATPIPIFLPGRVTPADVLPWVALALGMALLIIAGVTTYIRRRG